MKVKTDTWGMLWSQRQYLFWENCVDRQCAGDLITVVDESATTVITFMQDGESTDDAS